MRPARPDYLGVASITSPADQLLTTSSASLIAHVVPDTFRLWRRLGKITPACITPTGIALYRRQDVERLAEERAARHEPPTGGEAA
jgi:hypothetical protein